MKKTYTIAIMLLFVAYNSLIAQNSQSLIQIHNVATVSAMNNISSPFTGNVVYVIENETIYHYNGSQWVQLADANSGSSSSWNLSGNSGNVFSNFLGTTDNVDLRIRTNSLERLIIPASTGGSSPRWLFPKVTFDGLDLSNQNSGFIGFESGSGGRLRVSAGNSDSFDNSQGASIDLHGNGVNGGSGRLDLVAGSGAAGNSLGINFYTGNSLRATMLGNGNFGINTFSPSSRFHINGGGFRYVDGNQANGRVLTSDANGNASWQDAASGGGSSNAWDITGNSAINPTNNFIGTTNQAPIRFRTNNTLRMELDALSSRLAFYADEAIISKGYISSGRIRISGGTNITNIGTSSDGGAIDLFGIGFTGNTCNVHVVAGNPPGDTQDGSIHFITRDLGRMLVNENGDLILYGNALKPGGGGWTNISDKRLKKNVKRYQKGLTEILNIEPVTYQYNEKSKVYDTNKTYVGIIAQEIEKILPSTVITKNDSANTGLNDKKVFDSSELLYTLINAVKELNDKNIELENKLNQLEKLSQSK